MTICYIALGTRLTAEHGGSTKANLTDVICNKFFSPMNIYFQCPSVQFFSNYNLIDHHNCNAPMTVYSNDKYSSLGRGIIDM